MQAGLMEAVKIARRIRPRSKRDLKNYVKAFLGVDVPDVSVCDCHVSPMDYLWHSFSSDFTESRSGDCVVWANRGGGKTEVAAIATLLDCVFKPGCEGLILGGSLEQSRLMYDYFLRFAAQSYGDMIDGRAGATRCEFKSGSGVELLTQSAANVRGRHVHKLRCDEVELFDPEIFAAAKFVTNSSRGIKAGMEILSTMHRPYGLMQEAVEQAQAGGAAVFKWCIWEVIEKCRDRSCSQCPLWCDCGGKAREGTGYYSIDDCITQMRRSSRSAWESEMLCRKPSMENAVFADFDAEAHVGAVEYDEGLAVYRAMDFGFVNPFVCLFIQVDQKGVVRVIDEYIQSRARIETHAVEVLRRTPGGESRVAGTFADPAGMAANDVTGTSAIKELRNFGITCRCRQSGILEGVELIRRALRDGAGNSSIVISPRCKGLIQAMKCYHYPQGAAANAEMPIKDGVYDHPIDALRYFFVNWAREEEIVREKKY